MENISYNSEQNIQNTIQSEPAEQELNFRILFNSIVKNVWVIALVAIICGLVTLVGSILFLTPMYRASALFYVNNSVALGDASLSISSGDISTSKSLVDSYMVILKTRDTLMDVIDYGDLDCSYGELSSMISASDVNNTEIFKVTVSSDDPKEAEQIANALAYVVPKRISSIIEGSSAKVVDYAVVPSSPYSPNYTQNAIKGFLFGLFLSAIVIVLVELVDITIKKEEDVKSCCKYPILAMVPNMNKSDTHGYYYHYYAKSYNQSDNINADQEPNAPEKKFAVFGKDISFTASEAYKLLRTKLQYSFADGQNCHVFAVSSAMAGEGKSITSINLAYSLTQLNKRILLIDCDMRRPTLAKRLSLDSYPGLTEHLTGIAELRDIFQQYREDDEQNPITVITAGNIPPNPIELLSSEKMSRAIETLRTMFDYIVLDMPPVCEVSDALVAPKLADGILLVVRLKYANRIALKEAIQQFEFVKARILGIVLNYNTDKGSHYRRYKYRSYSSRYGYRYGYKYGYQYGYRYAYRNKQHDRYLKSQSAEEQNQTPVKQKGKNK